MDRLNKGNMNHSPSKIVYSLCEDTNCSSEEIAKNIGALPSVLGATSRNLLFYDFVSTTVLFGINLFSSIILALVGAIFKLYNPAKYLKYISLINEICWTLSLIHCYDIGTQVVSLKCNKGLKKFIDDSFTKNRCDVVTSHRWILLNTEPSFISYILNFVAILLLS